MPRLVTWLLAALPAIAWLPSEARADERAVDRFGPRDGLPSADVTAIAQDSTGFVWVGTNAGLARSHGQTVRPWASDSVRGRVVHIAPVDGDRLFVAEMYGSLWEVDAHDADAIATEVLGPDGTSMAPDDMLVHRGALWVAVDGGLWRRDADEWTAVFATCFAGDPVRRVTWPDASVLHVATGASIWRADGGVDACPERLADARAVVDLLVTDTAGVHAIEHSGRWWSIQGGEARLVRAPALQGRGLARRGTDVWAAYSDELAVLRSDGTVQAWGSDAGMPRGTALLVDHEAALWVATYAGLLRYVEPDTIASTLRDGDDAIAVLHLTELDGGLMATSWRGSALATTSSPLPRLHALGDERRFDAVQHDRPCRDADGTLWGSHSEAAGPLVHDGTAWSLRAGDRVRVDACATASDGSVWLATAAGLRAVGPRAVGKRAAEPSALPWSDRRVVDHVFEDRQGRTWVASGTDVCVRDRDATTWACDALDPRAAHLVGFADGGDAVWAATAMDGLHAFVDGTWTRLAGSDELASRSLYALRPSPRGGVWIAGSGFVARVIPRDDPRDGFEIVERLGRRHGLVDAGASDIVEDRDGALWLASAAGLTRVPAHVRTREMPPPRLALDGVRVDGVPAAWGELLELPSAPGLVEIAFAPLSFTESDRLRYRVRLSPGQPWSEPLDHATLHLLDPAAGSYAVQMAISTDGVQWWPATDIVRLHVAAPAWQEPWFWALAGLAAAACGYAVQRLRVAVKRRLAHQRQRIAMDLHDDLGSGLGSIRLVADLLSRPDVQPLEKRALAGELRDTAAELGTSLRSLVWTLRDDGDSLDALANQLVDRAAGLFPGERPRLVTELALGRAPVELSLAVRRNLLSIAQEALHNAVRHADADVVVLGLRVDPDRRVVLWVQDDGRGGVELRTRGTGMGLANLHRRAEEIGASLAIGPGSTGRGTRVEVRVVARAADRRLTQRGAS